MRVVHLAWLLALIATSALAQKSGKGKAKAQGSSSHFPPLGPAGPSGSGYQAQPQTQAEYAYAPAGQSSHGQGHGHGQGKSHGHGHAHQGHGSYSGGLAGPASAAKPNYALLLSDSRSMNNDGTINFNYAADNGLQQGETVDPDGTRRGYYSYPGADGKPITVKYTAGKNGFVAEGDHLPRQPNAAAHSEKDEVVAKGPAGHAGHGGAYYGNAAGPAYAGHSHKPAPAYGGNEYRPKPYSGGGGHQGGGHYNGGGHDGGHYSGPPAVQYSQGPAPHYSGGHGGHGHGHGGGGRGGPPPGGFGGFGAAGFKDFGPVNYGAPSHGAHHAAPQTQYNTHAIPSHGGSYNGGGRGHGGGFSRGPVHSAFNPYQQAGAAGPYSGQFDLGNGGQFSIDFNPGKPQEVQPGGDFGGHIQSQPPRY